VLHRSQGGLGIGLTLVRSLVEMHGGSVEAHSDGPGRGARFVVKLPAMAITPAVLSRPGGGRDEPVPPLARPVVPDKPALPGAR
jgi:hypothetical protein